MATVAVLGANGFIGAHVALRFLLDGWDVVATSREGARTDRLPPATTRLSQCHFDLLAPARSELWDVRADVLVNCTGYGVNPRETDIAMAIAVNATALQELIRLADESGIARVIHFGSAAEYGACRHPVCETDSGATRGMYATTKLAGTLIALQAAAARSLDLCVVRPFACYGALENREKFIPGLLAAVRECRPIDLSPGTQIRDYSFAGDVAAAIVGLARPGAGTAGGIFNICSAVPVTIRALGMALIGAAGGDQTLARWGALPLRPGENGYLVGNGMKLHGLTGWRATTPLSDGLAIVAGAEERSNEAVLF